MLMRVLAAAMIAATNVHMGSVLKANTRILCELGTTIDSRTAQTGDTFTLDVNDPGQPLLRGAIISGHITHVVQASGGGRTRISFLLDTITFANNNMEQIRAFVVSPNVVTHVVRTPQPVSALPTGRPGVPNSIVWQTQLGPKTQNTTPTGGTAYASHAGGPILAHAGMAVTVELASDLTVP